MVQLAEFRHLLETFVVGEIDIVLERAGGHVVAMEIKAGSRTTSGDLGSYSLEDRLHVMPITPFGVYNCGVLRRFRGLLSRVTFHDGARFARRCLKDALAHQRELGVAALFENDFAVGVNCGVVRRSPAREVGEVAGQTQVAAVHQLDRSTH